ncbi:hypothetical protein PENSUB_7191, partial [Penicillium subrubescens]
MVVWPQGEPLHPAGYISRPPVDPDCRATATAPGAPGCPRMPRPLRPCWGAPPSTGQFGCVENRPRELASLGVSKTVPTSPRPPAGQLWAGCESPPPPTPCHPLSPTRAAHLPTGNWPAPPGASRASPPPRRAGWPASHRPSGRRGLRVVRRAPRPPAQGERTPARGALHHTNTPTYGPNHPGNGNTEILESIIATRIAWAVEEHGLLPKTHLGGRKGISVDHAIQLILDRVHRAWGRGKRVSMLLLDVAGAYDNVSHERLLHN